MKVETEIVDEVDHAAILKRYLGSDKDIEHYVLNLYDANGQRLDLTDEYYYADLFPGIHCSGDTIRDPNLWKDGDQFVIFHEVNAKQNDVLEDPEHRVQQYHAYLDLGDVEFVTDAEKLVNGEFVEPEDVPQLPSLEE